MVTLLDYKLALTFSYEPLFNIYTSVYCINTSNILLFKLSIITVYCMTLYTHYYLLNSNNLDFCTTY